MHNNRTKLFEHLTGKGFMASDAWDAVEVAYRRPPGAPKIVFIAHAISGNVQANLVSLRDVIRRVHARYPDVVPFCPYYADVVALGEAPETRERGLRSTRVLLQAGFVDEVWLTGKAITAGMVEEARVARDMNVPVIDKTAEI